MITYEKEESMMSRVMSILFPPSMGVLDAEGLALVGEYQNRLNRRGVENKPGLTPVTQVGIAQPKRIIHLPGRIV